MQALREVSGGARDELESVAPSDQAPVGIAIVGAGGWGRNHVRNFASLPSASLRWVVDTSPRVRSEVALAYPGVRTTELLEEALLDEEVEGVVVATPAASHYEHARAALEAGKDVLVEKPLALEAEHAEVLVALAEARGRVLAVGHLLLYHPALVRLRELVRSGELGDVLYVYAQRLNLGVVRRDENAWWSLAPHDISVASYLLDAEPVAVSATGSAFLQKGRGIEDVVFATLHFADARLAHVHVSWLDPHKTRQITVVGSQKMAIFDDTSPDEKLKIFDKGAEPPPTLTYDEGVRIRTGEIRVPALRMREPLQRECLAFIEAVRTRVQPLADGRAGLGVVRVLEAGSRSLAAGGARVAVRP